MRNKGVEAGEKYNRLTAIKFVGRDKWRQHRWLFRCDCGNEKVITAKIVKRGDSKSCGCLKIDKLVERNKEKKNSIKHGLSFSPTHNAWRSMKQRCLNSKEAGFKNYGGRGISICDRWLGKTGFQKFYKDMRKRPKNMSLDRIDNDGNYEPKNCRWATRKEQAENRRDSIFVSVNGVRIPFSELAYMFGLRKDTLYRRIFDSTWTLKEALTKKLVYR